MALIKDLGFLAWKNDLAGLESQTGTQWTKAIDNENTRFKAALQPLKSRIHAFKSILKGRSTDSSPWHYKGWQVSGVAFSREEIWLKDKHFQCKVWDADVCKGYFAGAVQDSAGFERFSTVVYKGIKQIATLQKTGPQVAWLSNGILVYLGSSSDLRYDSLHTWCPKTKATTLLYKTLDPTENLEIRRAEDGSVYVLVTDFVTVRLGFVVDTHRVEWEHFPSPVKDIAVITRDSWVINNTFPLFPKDVIVESVSLKGGFAITRDYGIRTVWQLFPKAKPKQMITVWGEVSYDSRDPYRLTISDMRYESYTVKTHSANWALSSPDPHPYLFSRYTDVAPVFVVLPSSSAVRGLLITAYGAYGIPTRIGSLVPRWRPLLESGWAVASVCVPGSGDHDNAWKTAGQRLGRGESIRVFTETIQRLQEELGIQPSSTALYGRSAGGLLCIAAALASPQRVGALYVESPYVDVLRTISNPSLPLTLLETKEFGIGSNPTNILTTGAWSPMEKIPVGGIPDLFVVARSDTADLQVYPYEVVKWIQRMRSKDTKKLLYIGSGKGHFTTTLESRAEDLALLENWLEYRGSPDGMAEKKPAPRTTLCQNLEFGRSSNSKCKTPKKSSPTGRILSSTLAFKKNHTYKYNTMPNMNVLSKKNKTRKNRGNNNNNAGVKNGTMTGGRRRRHHRKGRKHTRRH